ncbi:MAG: urea carboxylase-associated family protein [Dehalococcoidia bacterium]
MTTERRLVSQKHIPAYSGGGAIVRQAQRVKVVNLQGQQVADLFAFVLNDPGEFLSPSNTLGRLGCIYPQVGEPLYSNLVNPILTLEEDTVGVNDLLFQACDSALYESWGGQVNHPNCRENLNAILGEYDFTPAEPPHPVNLFQNTPVINLDGQLEARDSPAKPGDYVMMEALKDLLVIVTACSWDKGPLNGERPTDLMLEVYEG